MAGGMKVGDEFYVRVRVVIPHDRGTGRVDVTPVLEWNRSPPHWWARIETLQDSYRVDPAQPYNPPPMAEPSEAPDRLPRPTGVEWSANAATPLPDAGATADTEPRIDRAAVVRYLIGRLAALQRSAMPMDFGRIEELCFLINTAMAGDFVAQDGNEIFNAATATEFEERR